MITHIFWQHLAKKIETTGMAILVITAAAEKGSPGNVGFAMSVCLKDATETDVQGTIGGGIMEQNLIAEAKDILQKQATVRFCRKLHHFKHPRKTPSGLICAGSQTIILLSLTREDLPVLRTIARAAQENSPLYFLATPQGLKVEESIIEESTQTAHENLPLYSFSFTNENEWSYSECVGAPHTAYIVGGGHVGLALSRQLSWLNFRTIVLDSREIATTDTLKQNTFADLIITTPYTNLAEYIPEQNRTYVIIVTSSYPTDVQALVSLSGRSFPYIGLMGSRAKIATIFREAEAAGIPKDWLSSIHAPLGLDINSDSPEEIAVSIAAELIALKNR